MASLLGVDHSTVVHGSIKANDGINVGYVDFLESLEIWEKCIDKINEERVIPEEKLFAARKMMEVCLNDFKLPISVVIDIALNVSGANKDSND